MIVHPIKWEVQLKEKSIYRSTRRGVSNYYTAHTNVLLCLTMLSTSNYVCKTPTSQVAWPTTAIKNSVVNYMKYVTV